MLSMSLHRPSAKDDNLNSEYLREIRERLWRALRAPPTPDAAANEAADDAQEASGQLEERTSSDVHTGPTAPAAPPLELTPAEMQQVIECVFCCLHSNATPDDTAAAAAAVLAELRNGEQAEAEKDAPYAQADVEGFLDRFLLQWLPELAAAVQDAATAPVAAATTLWEDVNAELVDCIVSDATPSRLLQPSEVLTLQRTISAVELEAPLLKYLTLSPHHGYPPIYDTLFAKLRLDDRSGAGLTVSQFRLFFNWFYAMHFRNTNLPRANAAADVVYHRHCDARGALTVTQFQRACEELCAVYAQRRDAASYLQQLVQRTERVVAESQADGSERSAADEAAAVSAAFFLHPEKVTVPAWQRDLLDPAQLYLPDELRAVQQEAERHRCHTSPRILLTGPAGVGKTTVGKELADALRCVHLDVVELAVAALQERQDGADDSTGAVIAACLQSQSPIPMATQVALLRAAMLSPSVEHRGYVFSDTIASNTADEACVEAVEEAYVRPLRLFEDARPTHVVELVCAVPEVYGEVASSRAAAVAEAFLAVRSALTSDAEAARQAAEKARMKADCEKILAHLAELESAGPEAAVSAEDVEVARQQAVEAQGILDALNAEAEEEVAAATTAAQPATADGAGVPPEATATPAQEAHELRLRVRALVHDGRVAAGLLPSEKVAPLDAQDWTRCWRKSVEFAKSLGRHLSVDPIASDTTADVVSYITHAFHVRPCHLAEALRAPGENPEAVNSQRQQQDPQQQQQLVSTLAEDEERCRAVEALIQEQSLQPSPVWKHLCPVTAAIDDVLIDGAACYAATYRGYYYFCASAAKRDSFVQNPTRYLRHTFPEKKAVLLLADDSLVETSAELLTLVAQEMAVQLRLTPYTASQYARQLEPRQALLHARRAAQESRQAAEAALRKARQERQEQLTKAPAKKAKGKLEPTKPKGKRLSESAGRTPSMQTSQQLLPKSTTTAGRRRVQKTALADSPRSKAEEKQRLIDAARERAAREAPLLVTATTHEDLQEDLLLQRLLGQRLLPETVVVLQHVQDAGGANANGEEAAEAGEADDGDAAAPAADGAASKESTSPFQRILQVFEKHRRPDGQAGAAAVADGELGEEGGAAHDLAGAPSFVLHTVAVDATTATQEIMAEVMHRLSPLAVQASEDTVDEALGEADANEEEDGEGEGDDDDAILYPEGTERPPVIPAAPRDPLVKPMRRFLHQFGSRLDFCPVTLHDRGILVRGKQEFCLRYVDGLYIFASEEARDAFARCPQRYVGELPPQDVPPRVWLVGVTQSGKKTLASGLQEAYRLPHFVYDRQFFEECVEAALAPGGAMVRGVYIPPDTAEANPFLKRAMTLLKSVRDRAKEEKKSLEEKAEAERLLEEHERKLEERENAGDDDEEDDEDDNEDWSDEKEAALQAKLEFEPEDEEEKQVRLSESYLRIASCVTRFKPFDKLGYVMVCPPFSDGDLDVLFDEGGIPEVVVRLNVDEDIFNERSAMHAAARRAAAARAAAHNAAALERKAVELATQSAKEAAKLQRAREKALAKWRRRHIGANDVDVPSDAEEEGGGDDKAAAAKASAATPDEPGAEEADASEAAADRQAQEDALEEFVTFVEERRVKVVKVNAAAAKETVRRTVVEALGRHLRDRASLFYQPEVLQPEEAEARLASGLYDWSSFGDQDPVRLFAARHEGQRTSCRWKPDGVRVGPEADDEDGEGEGEKSAAAATGEGTGDGAGAEAEPQDEAAPEEGEPEEMSEAASDEVEELRNAVRRRDERVRREAARRVARLNHRLYSFDSDATLLRFLRNPWPFVREPPPSPPLPEAPVVALYEPDSRATAETDGRKRRCLADSVAFNLGCKCVSASSLLSWAAVHAHWQALRLECMLGAQQSAVDAGLVQRLLTLYLSSASVKQRGAVLHNMPMSAEAARRLAGVPCAASVVKVMSALPSSSDDYADAEAAVQAMTSVASVSLPLPHPHAPLDSSNLVTAVHDVEAFAAQASDALLREARAFPVALRGSYHVFQRVRRHLSEYGTFCPYEWVEKGDLVRTVAPSDTAAGAAAAAMDLSCAAKYLGHYFFFSSQSYLARFLADPTTVTDPVSAKPLPKHLPSPVPPTEAAGLQEGDLALEGCCPVLLYDTRERLGMRGVRQPIAKKGSLDCVVDYEGHRYAMLTPQHRDRFLRRPWQYAQEAQLPAVLRRPLRKSVAPSSLSDPEEYMQRQLYDPVAQALLAVGRERPIYPGLSVEESALKYVALYLKAHRDPDTMSAFEAQSYHSSFELFHRRSTLYRRVAARVKGGVAVAAGSRGVAAADAYRPPPADGGESDEDFCAAYEELQAEGDTLSDCNRLPAPSSHSSS